jgi:translation initiation factor IF-2
MNISTLAKTLGVSVKELREVGQKTGAYGFSGRNTRIPYNSALEVTKILRPDKLDKLKNDDKIYLPAVIKVGDFAETIGKPVGMVVKSLLMSGVMATLNEQIDYDTASLIAEELNVKVYPENDGDFDSTDANLQMVQAFEYADVPGTKKEYTQRPPVVTIMGHVDHGKTTLLDYIRKSQVASGEAGSITQHISSYRINFKNQEITFVDTPGHEAFTAMRARGSQLADFVILVVSAVEGPKPQTVEVIERSKLSKVPLIVAINKTDLPESDPERVKTEISQFGIIPEEWGGTNPFINISAKTGKGVDSLLETILLHAEVADLKGEINCPGQALTIESNRDRSMGVVTTALINKAELKVGDIIRAGEYVGKIRKLETTAAKPIQKAVIGDPVIITGLPEIINIGEPIIVYKNLRQAQTDASTEKARRAKKQVYINNQSANGEKIISLVLKADVAGSLEAIKEAIIKIPQEHAKIVIKQESVGEVTEGDVEFSNTSGSTILAFHTNVQSKAEKLIQKYSANLVKSDIIYELLEWVEESMLKFVVHEIKITSLGKAEVLATFKSEKSSIQIFGGEVKDGKIFDNKNLRVWRDNKEIGKLEIVELQKNKSKANEVYISQQFGISVTGNVKIQKGDIVESIDETVVS